MSTDETIDVKPLIGGLRYDEAIARRGLIRERLAIDDPLYACAYCGVPVYLLSQTDKRRFFVRHTLEDDRCEARTRGHLSQEEIRARQHQGMREGAAHKALKGFIERNLRSDPLFRDVAVESTWRSARDPKQRRQPDVSANYSPFGRIAFEAQVSNTFLDVVAGRRVFYREQGALLIWVLKHFEPNYRRLMIDDVLFSNNSNVFIVDEETTRLSEDRGAFHIRCHFRRPYRDGFDVKEEWGESVIPFAGLTLDVQGQQAFAVDFAGDEKRLHYEAEQDLRREFFELFDAEWPHADSNSPMHVRWAALKDRLARRGLDLPGDCPQYDSAMRTLVIAVRSMELGRPIVWKDATLVASAHRVINSCKPAAVALIEAIQHFGRKDMLMSQDKSEKWAKRKIALWQELLAFERDYLPIEEHISILKFLYPQIGRKVENYLERYWTETTS